MEKVPSNVLDKKLYLQVKTEAKRKFKVWPSAYASAYLVKTYKSLGGRYSGQKDDSAGLSRWFAEEWVDICYYPEIVECGRPVGGYNDYARQYPYCRPLKRVNSRTPKTISELSDEEIKRRCKTKRTNPKRKVT